MPRGYAHIQKKLADAEAKGRREGLAALKKWLWEYDSEWEKNGDLDFAVERLAQQDKEPRHD